MGDEARPVTEPTTALPGDAVNEGGSILKLEGVQKRFGNLEVLRAWTSR